MADGGALTWHARRALALKVATVVVALTLAVLWSTYAVQKVQEGNGPPPPLPTPQVTPTAVPRP